MNPKPPDPKSGALPIEPDGHRQVIDDNYELIFSNSQQHTSFKQSLRHSQRIINLEIKNPNPYSSNPTPATAKTGDNKTYIINLMIALIKIKIFGNW